MFTNKVWRWSSGLWNYVSLSPHAASWRIKACISQCETGIFAKTWPKLTSRGDEHYVMIKITYIRHWTQTLNECLFYLSTASTYTLLIYITKEGCPFVRSIVSKLLLDRDRWTDFHQIWHKLLLRVRGCRKGFKFNFLTDLDQIWQNKAQSLQ